MQQAEKASACELRCGDGLVEWLHLKRGCLVRSFLFPAFLVALINLDEILWSGAPLADALVPYVLVPSVLGGACGTALYLCVKLAKHLR